MNLQELKARIISLINDSSIDSAFTYIRQGLKDNLFDSDLYYYMGLAYKHIKNYNCAYLCFENALQYAVKEDFDIIGEMNTLKENDLISVNDYSIVMLTFNNLNYTIDCIESIRRHNRLNNYEIIVIDNNSTDDTPGWLKSQCDIKYILNNENKGFPAGCNQGINIAKESNDIFLLNNDTILMPNSIFNLRMALYSNNTIGAAGSVSNSVPYFQMINEKFEDISQYEEYSLMNNITNDKLYDYRLKLIGYAMLIKRQALNKAGVLDEIFTPGNFEDDDISLRIIESGYKNILCRDSFIFHYGSKSFGKDLDRFRTLLKTNSRKFKDKWTFDSQNSLFIRQNVLELIDEPLDSNFKILEIGCSCGATMLEINNIYPNAQVFGIDFNDFTYKISKLIGNVDKGDINNLNLNHEENFFDYILLSDTLENTKDPLQVLNDLKKYLKDDGYILATIPNALHFSALKNLIDGTSIYNDKRDIFTHNTLNSFTQKDISKIFADADYKNTYILPMENMPQTVEEEEFIHNICRISNHENIEIELTNYEYYVKAQKSKLSNSKTASIKNDLNILVKELNKSYNNKVLLNEIVNLIKNENISPFETIKAIENKVSNAENILNFLAVICFENDLKDYTDLFLKRAAILQ